MRPVRVKQELIGQVNKEAGDYVAPAFAVLIIVFLLAFVAYFTMAVIALVFYYLLFASFQ